MARSSYNPDLPSLADYLAVLRRRIWVVLSLIFLFTTLLYAYSARKPPVYGTTAQVLLDQSNISSQILGFTQGSSSSLPDRYAVTQAQLARVRSVAGAAAEHVPNATPASILSATTVTAAADADLPTFAARDGDPGRATLIANQYAKAYANYKSQLDRDAVTRLLDNTNDRLETMRSQGLGKVPLYAKLQQQREQLVSLTLLQTPSAVVVAPAGPASRISGSPKKNAIIGFGVGLLFGIALAFLVEALDPRLRSPRGIADALALPLLGTIPRGRRL